MDIASEGRKHFAARDEVRGREAVYALGRDDRLAEFLQLDVTDRASIERVRDILVAKHGGLDILINNAGISGFDFLKSRGVDHQTPEISPNSPESQVPANEAWSSDVLRQVIDTNFFGILNVCEILFPILRSHAR
jgi:NAD(P)-dependent dehydrogenase (short-subunit alcohol dehydrogenase family)